MGIAWMEFPCRLRVAWLQLNLEWRTSSSTARPQRNAVSILKETHHSRQQLEESFSSIETENTEELPSCTLPSYSKRNWWQCKTQKILFCTDDRQGLMADDPRSSPEIFTASPCQCPTTATLLHKVHEQSTWPKPNSQCTAINLSHRFLHHSYLDTNTNSSNAQVAISSVGFNFLWRTTLQAMDTRKQMTEYLKPDLQVFKR